MTEFLADSTGQAILIFGVLLLFVVALSLLWEGYRRWRTTRTVSEKLDRISEPKRARREQEQEEAESLLREGDQEHFYVLERVLLYLPHREDIAHLLDQADLSWTVGTFVMLSGGLGAGAGLAFLVGTGGSTVPALVAGLLGISGPYLYVRRRKRKRIEAFEEHFPDAIDLLARALRAGHAFTTGLQVIADEAPEPVSDEFRQVFEEQRYGLPLRESLLALADRIELVDMRMFVTSVLIQRESGGNLAENLDNLAEIIRERFKFQRDLRTATAHGRLSGMVLAGAPVAAGVGMYLLNPEYTSLLWTEELGRWMLAGAALMQIMGFLVIQKIVDIEF